MGRFFRSLPVFAMSRQERDRGIGTDDGLVLITTLCADQTSKPDRGRDRFAGWRNTRSTGPPHAFQQHPVFPLPERAEGEIVIEHRSHGLGMLFEDAG